MSNKQLAVAMVRLVKEAARCKSGFLALKSVSLDVLRAQECTLGSFELSRYLGNRETALLAALFAGDGNYFRIGGDQFDSVAIHHEQTKRQTDLLRGQPDTAGVVHRFEHVSNE